MTVKDDISFQGNFDPSPESAERTEGWSHSQESGAFNQALLVSRMQQMKDCKNGTIPASFCLFSFWAVTFYRWIWENFVFKNAPLGLDVGPCELYSDHSELLTYY